MKRYCLALDLINDAALISEYEKMHLHVWPEILESIKSSGILDMKIYRLENRMMMVMEVNDHFSFEDKGDADSNNPKVQEWETLMWKYQQPFPFAKNGEKWMLMQEIFSLL
jgi:L-rhamnose mutarotase